MVSATLSARIPCSNAPTRGRGRDRQTYEPQLGAANPTEGLTMPKSKTEAPTSQSRPSKRATEDSPEILDWDACLETPPPRPAGTIKARLNFLGRGKPIPLPDPECPDDAVSREER